MKGRIVYSTIIMGLLIGLMLWGLFGSKNVKAVEDAAVIDRGLLDLINQYINQRTPDGHYKYYSEEWDITLDQYKAWIATIAWAEGGKGGYTAHSQYGKWNKATLDGDRFDHIAKGNRFRFSTGIGSFQLDRGGGSENWHKWSTIKKLNLSEAVKSVLRWHKNNPKFGRGATLEDFSRNSPWLAVRPGKVEVRWKQVTGTKWDDHKNRRNNDLKWADVVNRIAIEGNPNYSYRDNIKYIGKIKWNIDKSEDIKTDAGKKVIFNGYFPTWLINARTWGGTKLFDYYYTYNESSGCEVWVWNNSGEKDEFRYIFVRNYTTGQFPEHRTHNGAYWIDKRYIAIAGESKLKKPALNIPKGDVVFVFDATGSMRWIIEDMQSKAIGIMNDIRASVPDTRFGVGSFTDYPGYYSSYGYSNQYGGTGDYAWRMDLDLTDSINDAQDAINSIVYGWGADGPQDYTRVVYETTTFNWRPDATKIVVLFGDAPPHSAPSGQTLMCPWNPSEKLFSSAYGGDPGRDGIMFTDDDLDYGPVVEQVADEDIIFICVDCQSGSGSGYCQDAHNNFRYLAYKTGGSVFEYTSEEVANEIINRILEEELSFYFVHLTDTHYGYEGARNRVNQLIDDIISLSPTPDFVIISGDLVSWGADSDAWPVPEENSYTKFKNDFDRLKAHGINYYCCPGNHDYYMWPYGCIGLGKYHNKINSHDRYYFISGNTCVISINSGCDDLIAEPFFPPKSSGLSDSDIGWLENVLDSLDGNPSNNCDTSGLNKIIFMHHPTINYMSKADGCLCMGVCWKVIPFPPFIEPYPCPKPCSRWDAGCIHNNRPEFKQLCDQYDVDAVLSGHIHWNRVYDQWMDWSSSPDDKDGYDPDEFPLSTYDKTLYVNTGAAYHGDYRMIKCKANKAIVWYQNKVIDEVIGTIYGCPVNLHLYNSNGNHVGRNETGDIEFEIENATYSILPVGNESCNMSDPAEWTHKVEEISLIYGADNYRYEIDGLGKGNFSFTLEKELRDDSQIKLYYDNISVTENFTGEVYIYTDSVDYTLYADDNGDGVIDREIQPDNVTANNVPYRPEKPSGPTLGDVGVLYTYSTSTTDPEGDQVYYWWDWGDGTNSGWLGPYYSGETAEASHAWNEPGTYEIKVRAKDGYNHISDWSPSLTFQTDIIPPVTTKTVGEPKYGTNDTWVTSHTFFNLTAEDNPGGTGVDKTYYRIWYKGLWNPEPGTGVGINNNFTVYNGNFTLKGECRHYLEYYSTDYAGNVEEVHNQTHFVDDTSPLSNITIGEPKFNWTKHLLTQIIHNIPPEIRDIYITLPLFVTNHTHFRLKAQDQGECQVGVGAIYYRTWNKFDGWTEWQKYEEKQGPIDVAKPGFTLKKQGPNHIEYYSQDLLQNKEKTVHNQTCLVDDTPPETEAFGYNPIILRTTEHGGKYTPNDPAETNIPREFPPVGLFYIHYRYKIGENGEWTEWFTSEPQYFTGYVTITHHSILDPIYVDYYATDILGNKEETHHDVFEPQPHPFYLELLSPENRANNLDINTNNLRWSSNAQSYDIYLGKTTPPPLLVSGWTSTSYDPRLLDYGTTYYWKIVAHSKDGQTKSSPVWCFTTKNKDIGAPGSGQNQPPQADFSFIPAMPKTGEEVFFQDESTDNDGDIVSWYWDFGDGSISVERNPRHMYTQPGAYLITLTVEDNDGAEDTVYNSLVVTDPEENNQNTTLLSIKIVKPEKAFYFNNKKILTTHTPIIIGSINIEAEVSDKTGVEKVEFYVDNQLKATDTTKPYTYTWKEKAFGKHTIKAIAYNDTETATDKIVVTKLL